MIGLDFETYCELDLKKVGLDNYLHHPSFTPLLASVDDGNQVITYELQDPAQSRRFIRELKLQIAQNKYLVAHNSAFEEGVIRVAYDIHVAIVDSAVAARIAGAGGSLEAAAPQLLGVDKMPDGLRLIRKFSMGPTPPSEEDRATADWALFKDYCELDATLSRMLGETYENEVQYAELTRRMNEVGWCVDTAAVEHMMRRVEENKKQALAKFQEKYDPAADLNLGSLKQLKAWCLKHKIRAHSFSSDNVDKLLVRIEKRAVTHGWDDDLRAVHAMLLTKKTLGGTSVTKLPVIKELTSTRDGRLRNQYIHAGAGQSRRTSGVGAQMQNLHRLGEDLADMATLADPDVEWTNDEIAANLRQVFTASHPDGQLIVGDFSSVESRGLAYLAGEEWKLVEYRRGKDMYKVLAAKKYNVPYEEVLKPQRSFGKVGELSCGYCAGPGAVAAFAEKMHVELTEKQAQEIVTDWRALNPKIVQLWADLDAMLWAGLTSEHNYFEAGNGLTIKLWSRPALKSITKQHPGAKDYFINVKYPTGLLFFRRIIRGVYRRGRMLCYHKPSERKTGDLWRDWRIDPATKQLKYYTIYGGKLAGILTQSMCREIFFETLERLSNIFKDISNVKIVGQFHDEIVLDWVPSENGWSLEKTKHSLERWMSYSSLPAFPMAAEIKSDYRYTK